MDTLFTNGETLNQATVETNTFGEKAMYQNGQVIATQKAGLFPGSTSTFEGSEKVAETKDNIINGTDVIQDGKHTGIIKEDVHGNLGLYDTNHNKLGHIDPNGNVQSVMNHMDPLSQANRVNFQELKFQHGE
ncbi:hypothetical protein [Litchfieldia salsa]|uniref:Uncharacterized protein n=1 Tax=Litchfieldia salsa TaxID=930152 RepID=A0A1H0W5C1_9BACI|nr:hypothetical protein [Litchfieldia salsa]SDP85788.1 hypothetical protein SAMN05216565_10969 [Litchfieldia salsa]